MRTAATTTEPRLHTIEDMRTVLTAAGFTASKAEGLKGALWAKDGATVFLPDAARGVAVDKCRRAVKRALAHESDAPAPLAGEGIAGMQHDWTPVDLFDFSRAETATWKEIQALMEQGLVCQRLVRIDKGLANEIIAHHNTHNRDLAASTISRYAADIRESRWGVTHQGIAFDTERCLIDGQHRLYAIDEADSAVWTWVAINQPRGAQDFVDQGKIRKALDVVRLSGDSAATGFQMATARAMMIGNRTQVVVSRQEQIAFFLQHRPAVAFVTDVAFQKRRAFYVVQAPVGGALGRAFYHADRDRLKRFGEVMLDGVSVGEPERPIILLREWLRNGAPREPSAQRVARQLVIYMKTERALVAYLNGEVLRTIYVMKDEAFPLPEEAAPRKSRVRATLSPGRPAQS